METSSVIQIYKKLREKEIKFVNYSLLEKISGLSKKNSLYKLAYRMKAKKLLIPLNKSGYFIAADSNPNDFEIANYLYRPSYISLGSALSFYGILSQFVYSVVSITTKKTKKMVFQKKEYLYKQIQDSLFWGYTKKDNFLIALPEKALLDTLYFYSKGIINIDLKELELSIIDNKKLKSFAKKFNKKVVGKLIKGLKL